LKKKHLKKVLGIVLLLAVMVTALSTTVSARYKHIDMIVASLTINSSGLATCEGGVYPSDSDTNTTLIVELQKFSGGSWGKDDSWSTSGTGTNTIMLSGKKYVVHGKYRVVVTAKVYSSSGALLENESCISHEVTY